MTAIVLPDIDRSRIEELKKRIPDLSEIELPNLPSRKGVGRTADHAIDRLLGRSRAPIWPWIAAGIGLVAFIGVVAALFVWFRRPTSQTQPESWSGRTAETEPASATTPIEQAPETPRKTAAAGRMSSASSGVGSVSTDGMPPSAPYPIEEA